MDSTEDNGDASAAHPKPFSVITNGAVSGVLPQAAVFAVNYPGYPSSISRAVDTLGGLDEIAKVMKTPSFSPPLYNFPPFSLYFISIFSGAQFGF